MNEKLDISVIIPVYNDWMFLERAIKSVSKQTHFPCEVIVVDDGSDFDGIERLCKEYQALIPKVPLKYIHKLNGGASSARNLGLKYAASKYISFLDVDDEITADGLKWRYDLICSLGPNFFGVYGTSLVKRPKKNKLIDKALIASRGEYVNDLVGRPNGYPAGSPFYLYRKSELTEVKAFDEKLQINEDFDVVLRMIQKGFKPYGENRPCFIRNIRKDSLSRSNLKKIVTSINMFLDKAEKLNLLSFNEIAKRRKQANLSFALKSYVCKDISYLEARKIVLYAFEYDSPSNFKEYISYMFFVCFYK